MRTTCLAVTTIAMLSHVALAGDIRYRSFSASAAIGPPAEAFAIKLQSISSNVLGPAGEVHFTKLTGIPTIPQQFAGDIISAVAAGEMGGGFDAAYISGSDLNKTWGFLFNSGVPFGPSFDEYVGFLYSQGLPLVQGALERQHRDVVAIPIVGSPEQLSGYFAEPMNDVIGRRGIGLAGLCSQRWVLRYLPPGENVLGLACDELVTKGKIARKNITFIQAVAGGGSLVDAVIAGTLNGFEFATPFDDVSQLFLGLTNPGTAGLHYVHTPGWQQQFLVTWMVVNKPVWNTLTSAQQLLMQTVAKEHVLSSYADNVRAQGPALHTILESNGHMVLTQWPKSDLERLRDATIKFLNGRTDDATFPALDRNDYNAMLEALRLYVRANDRYWDFRQVTPALRFDDWANKAGECWTAICRK